VDIRASEPGTSRRRRVTPIENSGQLLPLRARE